MDYAETLSKILDRLDRLDKGQERSKGFAKKINREIRSLKKGTRKVEEAVNAPKSPKEDRELAKQVKASAKRAELEQRTAENQPAENQEASTPASDGKSDEKLSKAERKAAKAERKEAKRAKEQELHEIAELIRDEQRPEQKAGGRGWGPATVPTRTSPRTLQEFAEMSKEARDVLIGDPSFDPSSLSWGQRS
jgi:hypothetical protein